MRPSMRDLDISLQSKFSSVPRKAMPLKSLSVLIIMGCSATSDADFTLASADCIMGKTLVMSTIETPIESLTLAFETLICASKAKILLEISDLNPLTIVNDKIITVMARTMPVVATVRLGDDFLLSPLAFSCRRFAMKISVFKNMLLK